MANPLDFLTGVSKLHSFYTEQVRMLAHAHNLTDEQAAQLLDRYGYHNVARAILHPAQETASATDTDDAPDTPSPSAD